MQKSEHINELAKALSMAQAEMGKAHKDSTNPFFKSNYADLESVWEACKEPLTKNGLSVIQFPFSTETHVGVETILLHLSGQYVSEKVSVELIKKDAQSMGSAISYLRRYSLAAVTGVVQTDDDGNHASDKHPAQFAQKKQEIILPPAQELKKPSFTISEAQRKLMFALSKEAGMTTDALKLFMKDMTNKEHSGDLTQAEFNKLIEALKEMKILQDATPELDDIKY